MSEQVDLFGSAEDAREEMAGVKQAIELVGEKLAEELGSIAWYASKQLEYWNLAFPHKRK